MSLQISVVMPNMKVEINNQIMFFFFLVIEQNSNKQGEYKNKQAIEDLVHLLFFPKSPQRI